MNSLKAGVSCSDTERVTTFSLMRAAVSPLTVERQQQTTMTREFVALVTHYLLEWGSSRWATAYHSLIELGPPVLPELAARFAESRDVAFRAVLVELARHVRSPDALPLFSTALQDDSPEVWKQALDGLVALASPAAIALLEQAMGRTPPGRTEVAEWQSWIQEALQQARVESAARGGVA